MEERRREFIALPSADRRAFYAIMTGLVFGKPTELVVNPSEIFHWGLWTQLVVRVRGGEVAFYGPVPVPGRG